MCDSPDTLVNFGSCSGIGCCQTTIPKDAHRFDGDFDPSYTNSKVYNFSKCSYVMVVEEAEFKFNTTYVTTGELSNATLPMVFDWAIGNTTCEEAQTNKSSYACISNNSVCFNRGRGYLCNCSDGYQGNPYLHGGCQGLSIFNSLLPLISFLIFFFFSSFIIFVVAATPNGKAKLADSELTLPSQPGIGPDQANS